MNPPLIKLEARDKLAIVTLNRSHKANALNRDMVVALTRTISEVADNRQIHAMLVRGAGNRVFCGGADLSEPGTMEDGGLWEELANVLLQFPVLSVAIVNGACIGGGLALALGCDIRICVAHASFGYPVLNNGLLPGRTDVDRLNTLVGSGRTSMILLGGQKISAEEALQWGLIDRIVPEPTLETEGEQICRKACDVPRDQVTRMKRCLGGYSV